MLAPCILPLLPIIVGGSITDTHTARAKLKPYVVTGSLVISIVLFTLLLKVSTAFISIPPSFWSWLSGLIVIFFGITMFFPLWWGKLVHKSGIEKISNKWLAQGQKKESFVGDIVVGLALGPVFTSCSPTYFLILGTELPSSFVVGLINLFAYALGLALVLLLIAKLGQRIVKKLGGVSDPRGLFKKTIAILFILVGIALITGIDKKIESKILDSGFNITNFEQQILEKVQ